MERLFRPPTPYKHYKIDGKDFWLLDHPIYAANFTVEQKTGAAPGTASDPQTYMDLKANDVASTEATSYQAPAAQLAIPTTGTTYSFEAVFRGHWTGTFTSISNVKFWRNAGDLATGYTIYAGSNASYVQPTNEQSTIAAALLPTSEGSAIGLDYASNYSAYLYMQARVAPTATQGDAITNQGSGAFRWQWDEA